MNSDWKRREQKLAKFRALLLIVGDGVKQNMHIVVKTDAIKKDLQNITNHLHVDVADIWFIAANCGIFGWFEEQPDRLTKPVVMGGHRGFIVHFDWAILQEEIGVGGRRGLDAVDYSRASLGLWTI